MRVISGKFKRSTLISVNDLSVRPVMDRVKEFIFNVIQHEVFDSEVCDIFAGSGALGIEALSRGAKHVTFIDLEKKAIDAIQANIKKFALESQTDVLKVDAINYVQRCKSKFDLIFCDPPYRYEKIHEIITLILTSNLLKPGGMLISEHHSKIQFDNLPHGYHIVRDKKFGKTIISMIEEEND